MTVEDGSDATNKSKVSGPALDHVWYGADQHFLKSRGCDVQLEIRPRFLFKATVPT